ncbi:hypothetical protein [Brevibacillus agri]|uniref:hypothetical protein n=1 Tax=Brevibacillus agri TaxID=51101 RepID=UPI002867C5BB|nr:hypothetical protein [Brevibacillus agri]
MAVRQLFYVLFGDEHPVSCFYAGKRSFSLGNHIVMHFAALQVVMQYFSKQKHEKENFS